MKVAIDVWLTSGNQLNKSSALLVDSSFEDQRMRCIEVKTRQCFVTKLKQAWDLN